LKLQRLTARLYHRDRHRKRCRDGRKIGALRVAERPPTPAVRPFALPPRSPAHSGARLL